MSYFPRLKESAIYRGAYFLVSLAVLLLDQWTKGVVMRTFQVHESREVVSGLFDLTYVQNSGAAFGLFASVDSSVKAIVLNSVAVLVFLIVTGYALRSSHKSVRLQMGLALILGGAVGNLLDRGRNSTYCPHCHHLLVDRDGYRTLRLGVKDGKCENCGRAVKIIGP